MANRILIEGGKPLAGEVPISGMKNAALPIVFATVLVGGVSVLENIPPISDITRSLDILRQMGASVSFLDRTTVRIDTSAVTPGSSPDALVCRIRGSSYLVGAELGRFRHADCALPGGCDFGSRPLDLHIKGFEALGATVRCGNRMQADAPDGLHGATVYFDKSSVGATVNVMLASVMADGLTVIENAAREPHIVDLANYLNTCGAQISGAGTTTIRVRGVRELHGCRYCIIPDMIEAGTYMVAAAATGGWIRVTSVIPKHVESISAKLSEMGVEIEEEDEAVTVRSTGILRSINLTTIPYPGFPTDMHPQFAPLLCLANGVSTITEGIFANRFRYVEELRRMGANIIMGGNIATFIGGSGLLGAKVTATDLRAGAAMVIAGMAAEGTTEIGNVELIARGYCDLVEKLQSVGADIRLTGSPDGGQ